MAPSAEEKRCTVQTSSAYVSLSLFVRTIHKATNPVRHSAGDSIGTPCQTAPLCNINTYLNLCVCLSVWGQSCVTWKGQKYKCANINKQALGAQIHRHTKHPYPDSVLLSCASDCQSLHNRCYTSCVIMALWLVESNTGQLRERDPDYPTFVLSHRETYKWLGPEGGLHMCVCVRECVDLGKWFSISVAGFNQLLNHQRNY